VCCQTKHGDTAPWLQFVGNFLSCLLYWIPRRGERHIADMPHPFFLFAPGAGAPSSHPWMQRWRERLSSLGRVETFDYSYMRQGRKRPDPLPQLIASHRQALAEARAADDSVILIGKSMGGRIGCHVALKEKVAAVVCLSYPLCGGGDPQRLRDQVLRELKTPVLFIQGTRDPLCPLDLLGEVREEMKAPNTLHVVEGADHSLLLRKGGLKRMGKTQEEIDDQILLVVAGFCTHRGIL
jgi:predicted alpha/beta-hydrolase family hydrolase